MKKQFQLVFFRPKIHDFENPYKISLEIVLQHYQVTLITLVYLDLQFIWIFYDFLGHKGTEKKTSWK